MSHILAKHTKKETHGKTSEPCIEPLEISHDISKQYDPITIVQIIRENWSQISACAYSLREYFVEQHTEESSNRLCEAFAISQYKFKGSLR